MTMCGRVAKRILKASFVVACVCFARGVAAQPENHQFFGSSAVTGRLIGDNFQISDQTLFGGDAAVSAAAAYNSSANEYLVVWTRRGFGGTEGRTSEILGRRISSLGESIGLSFQISQTTIGDALGARNADVAYSSTSNEYLVVFQSDLVERDRFEIFGQRITAAGEEVGDDFRISTTEDQSYYPSVTYNSVENEYFVVWEANQNQSLTDLDIVGQRLDAGPATFGAIGSAIGVSQMSDPIENRIAIAASVAYNSIDNEYLVTWQSDGGGQPELATEIFAQRLNAAGEELGLNDFRVSNSTAVGPNRAAFDAAVAFGDGTYVVVWIADGVALEDDQYEVFGARLDAAGSRQGEEFQISTMGSLAATALFPALSFSENDQTFLVAWSAVLGFNMFQVWGRDLTSNVSDTTGGIPLSGVSVDLEPEVTYNVADNELLIVWDDGEIEGQRYSTATNVGIDDPMVADAERYGVRQNFPNPFNRQTTIPFAVDRAGFVRLQVYDLLGREIANLLSATVSAGLHNVSWDAGTVNSGTYVYRLTTDAWVQSRLMIRW